MSDPKQTLSTAEVVESGLDDWRQLLGVIRARYRTGDFATGLALVDRVGALAEAADHHPDITLTYPEVVISMSSHDVDGITSRDIDLAREISAVARELGVTADVAGLTQLDIGLDTDDGSTHGAYYAALLGSDLKDGEPVDPSGQVPTIWWQTPGDADPGDPTLPPPPVEQRWHSTWVPTTTSSVGSRPCSTRVDGSSATRPPLLLGRRGHRRQPLLHLHLDRALRLPFEAPASHLRATPTRPCPRRADGRNPGAAPAGPCEEGMRPIRQSSLQHVRYDVRGPILAEAQRLEAEGHKVLKLNIGNTAPSASRRRRRSSPT
ncbi:4a-hydroxytetrahydrobiopterin dehydratase [Janibacter melonis]|uniref:4a-hydroxytetrahydrobiopterin dehydratase n=1 Tax=Janibacter melonis TaxID=262209 RepID=UPI0035567D87